MQIFQAQIDGRPAQYSFINILVAPTPKGNCVLPHRSGQFHMAICRECGFGALGSTKEQAEHALLATMNGQRHEHDVTQSRGHLLFNPELIDYIYDAFNPEGGQA